jgi:DNA-binding NarL/FixJ family response regulator
MAHQSGWGGGWSPPEDHSPTGEQIRSAARSIFAVTLRNRRASIARLSSEPDSGIRLSVAKQTTVTGDAAEEHGGEALRAVIVDSHELFRHGLRELLEQHEIEVVGEAPSAEESLTLVRRTSPDVVTMELRLPGMSGIEASRRLAESAPATNVLIVAATAERADVIDAIGAGAAGYLMKDASVPELVAGVRAAARGDAAYSPRAATTLRDLLRAVGPTDELQPRAELSEREIEVLRLVAQGKDNPQIARELFISPETVKNHISSVLGKLGLDNRIQAAVYAVRSRLV